MTVVPLCSGCWWTMLPEKQGEKDAMPISPLMLRALNLLSALLSLRLPQAWKVIQLSCITLWNIACRSNSVEMLLVQSGISDALLNIAQW